MPSIHIVLQADGMLAGIPSERLAFTEEEIEVGVLPRGMQSGKPSVLIAMHLPAGGGTVAGQTSVPLFLTAALAIYARYGDCGAGIHIEPR